MIKTNLITLILLFLITIALFTRISVKKLYLKEHVNILEWLFSVLYLLFTISNLDIYLLITDFYNSFPYTYILSFAYLFAGPVIYAIVMEIEIKKILKLKTVVTTVIIYFLLSNTFLVLLYSGRIPPLFGRYPYYYTTVTFLGFTIWSTITLIKKGKRDYYYNVKLFLCISSIPTAVLHTLGLDFAGMVVVLLNCFISIILYSVFPLLNKKEKYINSSQSHTEQMIILSKFKNIMDEEKLYLDPECKLEPVANRIGVRRDQLSQVINVHFNKRFSDVINEFRINYSISLLNTSMTILEIAMESGFSSKSSFYTYFKKLTGLTPLEYKKK